MPEETEVVEQEVTENQDTVNVETLSDEDIEKLVDEFDGDAENQEGTDEGEEAALGDTGDTGEEGSGSEELEKLRKQNEEKQALIDRQSTEVGETRKLMTQMQAAFAQMQAATQPAAQGPQIPTNDDFYNDPVGTMTQMFALYNQQQQSNANAVSTANIQNRQKVLSKVPDMDSLKPELKQTVIDAGYDEATAEAVAQGWDKINPVTAIAYGLRAKAIKELNESPPVDYKAEYEKVMAKIRKAAGQKPLSVKDGGRSRSKTPLNADANRGQIARMTERDIAEAMANL
jgi:hypothetical protein